MAREQTLEISQTNIKVGDILAGCTHWGCTRPYFFKVIATKGKKTLVLRELSRAFATEYRDNSPAFACMPEECHDPRFPHPERIDWGMDEGKIYPQDWGCGYTVKVGSGRYVPYVDPWDGEPLWGNCD